MYYIEIIISAQALNVYKNSLLIKTYSVSTSSKGIGEKNGSNQTPAGLHEIYAKFGADCPKNMIFIARKPTGEIFTNDLAVKYPEKDWILTRVLQLRGLESGKNSLGDVDTLQRNIYIHGCPDNIKIGTPQSKGCVLMNNDDVIALFDLVPEKTKVLIKP